MGRGGQLGGVAVHAQRQISGANDGDTAAPRGTQNGKLNAGTRWRSISLLFIGGGEMDGSGHHSKRSRPFLIKAIQKDLKVAGHVSGKNLTEKYFLRFFNGK